MGTLETSLKANCDRQAGRQREKATYRGSSYRSAQKSSNNVFWNRPSWSKTTSKSFCPQGWPNATAPLGSQDASFLSHLYLSSNKSGRHQKPNELIAAFDVTILIPFANTILTALVASRGESQLLILWTFARTGLLQNDRRARSNRVMHDILGKVR